MSKIAVYPGSFNPWHDGHDDVLNKSLQIFDKVVVAVGINPDKQQTPNLQLVDDLKRLLKRSRVEVKLMPNLLVDFVTEVGAHAVIKGLRNAQDLEYERTQQYWSEDLGLKVPTVYIIADRKHIHISSSAIRAIKRFTR